MVLTGLMELPVIDIDSTWLSSITWCVTEEHHLRFGWQQINLVPLDMLLPSCQLTNRHH